MANRRLVDRPPPDEADSTRAERPHDIADERGPHEAGEREHVADEESVVYTPSAWDTARGWVRTLTIWVVLALIVVETLLAFRFGFLLANANPNNGFVDFIYDASGPLAEPFEGIASQSAVDGGVFDPATAIGMIVYFVAALLLILLIWAVTAGPSPVGGHRTTARSSWSTREDIHSHH